MSLENPPAEIRPELNLTAGSTLYHLIAVVVMCGLLWSVIAATIGV